MSPWQLQSINIDFTSGVGRIRFDVLVEDPGPLKRDGVKAVASLLSAAPDLLSALAELYELGRQESIEDGELEAAQAAARKAMAKARGGK